MESFCLVSQTVTYLSLHFVSGERSSANLSLSAVQTNYKKNFSTDYNMQHVVFDYTNAKTKFNSMEGLIAHFKIYGLGLSVPAGITY